MVKLCYVQGVVCVCVRVSVFVCVCVCVFEMFLGASCLKSMYFSASYTGVNIALTIFSTWIMYTFGRFPNVSGVLVNVSSLDTHKVTYTK